MNLPTIIITAVVAAIFIAIVARGIIKRKNGGSSCSCGCSNCGMSDICHGKK